MFLLSTAMTLAGCGDDTPANDDVGHDGGETASTSAATAPGGTDDTATGNGMTTDEPSTADGASNADDSSTEVGTSTDDESSTGAVASTTEESSTTDEPVVLEQLRIEPLNMVLEIDVEMPASLDYSVIGVFDDGSEVDVTADVDTWAVSNALVGAMNGATLEVPPSPDPFFASTLVTATIGDVEGQAQVTVAVYRQTGDQQDLFFLLPFAEVEVPQEKPATFDTAVEVLDVFLNVDTTGSMDDAITSLQNSFEPTVVPAIEAEISDTFFGAGAFQDFPVAPYGEACGSDSDQPFRLLAEMTDTIPDVSAAIDAMGQPLGCSGGDTPESHFEALYQVATGAGIVGPGLTNVPVNVTGIGGVAFRPASMRVVATITDAVSNENNAANPCLGAQSYAANPAVAAVAHDRQQTVDALSVIGVRVISVAVADMPGECSPLTDGTSLAWATGATVPPVAWNAAPGGRPVGCAMGQCCTGINTTGVAPDANGACPLAYRVGSAGSGLASAIIDGVRNAATFAAFDVTTQVSGTTADLDGLPLPANATSADFILSVTPLEHGPVPLPGVPDPALTETAFIGVTPATPLSFTVEAANSFLPQESEPRLFIAEVGVIGQTSVLDTREVFFLVPPADLVR